MGVTPGDTWGSWGLLGVPGWPLRGYCGFPGDYWVLLGTTVDYWVLLWITVDYWGDSWGHLGLLGTPGFFWLATKRLLWIPGDYWVLLGTSGMLSGVVPWGVSRCYLWGVIWPHSPGR